MWKIILAIFLTVMIAGCQLPIAQSEEPLPIGNPTATDILNEDKEADIFQYNNLIYTNASNIEWVQDDTYEKGIEIDEISKQSSDSEEFTNGTASKLPVGTKIYQIIGNGQLLLMAEHDDEQIVYLALIEG